MDKMKTDETEKQRLEEEQIREQKTKLIIDQVAVSFYNTQQVLLTLRAVFKLGAKNCWEMRYTSQNQQCRQFYRHKTKVELL